MQGPIARARTDTLALLGITQRSWKRIVLWAAIGISPVGFIYYFRGGAEAMIESWDIVYGLATGCGIFLLIFLYHLWLAPYKIVGEKIDSLSEDIRGFSTGLNQYTSETRQDRGKATEEDAPLSDTGVWRHSPGAGRIAARLIMTALSIEEARLIYDGFSAATNKEHEGAANFAFLHRLNEEGYGPEVYVLAQELVEKGEEINLDGDYEQELISLYGGARGNRST